VLHSSPPLLSELIKLKFQRTYGHHHTSMPFLVFRIIGSVLIVAGLYSVLWGKHKESLEKEANSMEIPVAIKATDGGNGRILEIVELDDVQLEKAQANAKAVAAHEHATAVTVPVEGARMQGKDEA
jgi:hypothetical protein